jgi:hypothetical protein
LLQSRRDVWPCGQREEVCLKDQVEVSNGWEKVYYEKSFGACQEVDFRGFEELQGAEAVKDSLKVPQVFKGSLWGSRGAEGLAEEGVSEENADQESLGVKEIHEEGVGVKDQVNFGEEVKEEEDFL